MIGRAALEAISFTRPMRGTTLERGELGGVPVEWTIAPNARDVQRRTRVMLLLPRRRVRARVAPYAPQPDVPALARAVDPGRFGRLPHGATGRDPRLVRRLPRDVPRAARGRVRAREHRGCGRLGRRRARCGVALGAIDAGLPVPGALILLSPWADLENAGESHRGNAGTESFIGGQVLHRISAALLPNAASRRDWRVSPYHAPAGLLAQLPPTLIQVGGAEILLDDGVGLARSIAAAGATVELQEFAGQGHVVVLWNGVPEASRALKEIAAWVRTALPTSTRPPVPSESAVAEAASPHDGFGPDDLPA